MKFKGYVYIMFESKANNWSSPGDFDYCYRSRIIGVYDDYVLATSVMRRWEDAMEKKERCISKFTNSNSTTISFQVDEVPGDPPMNGVPFQEYITRTIACHMLRGE